MINIRKFRRMTSYTALIGVATFVLVMAPSVLALTVPTDMVTRYSPSIAQSSNNDDQPWHTLILSDHGNVPQIREGMYFATSGSKTFRINVAEGHCNMNGTNGNAYNRNKDYLYVDYGSQKFGISAIQACNGNLEDRIFTIPARDLINNMDHTGLYGVKVTVRWLFDSEAALQLGITQNACNNQGICPIRSNIGAQPPPPAQTGGTGSNMRFRLVANGGIVGYINTDSSDEGNPNNSIVHTIDYGNIYYPFGVECGLGDQRDKLVTVYDADNGRATQATPLSFYIAKVDRAGNVSPLPASAYYHEGGSIKVWDSGRRTNPNLGSPVQSPDGYPTFVPGNFENRGGSTQVRLNTVEHDQPYLLVVKRMVAGQFIYVGLPGDAIFGSPDFRCPSLTQPLTITPGTGLTGVFEPGEAATATASVNNGSDQPVTSDWTRRFWYESTVGGTTYEAGPDSFISPPQSGRTAFPVGTSTAAFPAWTVNPIPDNRIRICTSLQLSSLNPATTTIGLPNPNVSCRDIIKKPYFQVMNGDANAAVTSAAGCATPPGPLPTISAFNRNTGLYVGSGAQIAAFAAGAITEFTSGVKPKGLNFANTDATTYGGGFKQFYCIPDYWAGITNTNPETATSTSGNILTKGDVVVTSSSPNSTFNLNNNDLQWVVGKNIYINKDVTSLDGVYVASGSIYTCASGTTPYAILTMASNCQAQLVVNGALIAGKGIKLQRLAGSLNTGPAEIINYTPDVWLQALLPGGNVPGVVKGSLGKYQSITLLPPVL